MGQQSSRHPSVASTEIYHFGPIAVHRDAQSSQVFTQCYSFLVDPSTEVQFAQHLKHKNNSCPYLVQIRDVEVIKANSCSSANKVTVTFEYPSLTLQDVLDRTQCFSECEVARIFYQLLSAVTHLNQNDSYHGDICPKFVYLDTRGSDHIYKIFDSSYFHPLRNGYYRAQHEKSYCAPEILANLSQKRVYPLYDHNVADTFSIGLVALYCLSSVNPLGAYSHKYEIDYYYIESMFRLATRRGYNEDLIALVRECLLQRNRPTAHEVLVKFQELGLEALMNSTGTKYSLRRSRSDHNLMQTVHHSR